MRLLYPAAAFCAVTALVVAGACKKKEEKAPTAESVATTADVKAPETPPVLSAAAAKLAPGTKVAVIELEKGGTIEIELLEKEAPKTTANFVKLVEEKFYDGIPFHRVEPNFVVQAGDASLVGRANPDITLEVEKDKRRCVRGAVSMARAMAPGASEYGPTSPTQFFILTKDSPHLDKDFCVFGMAISGMDVVDGLRVNDVIKRVRILTVGEAAPTAAK